MLPTSHDRGQKPGDQREGGLFRLGDVLPQVLAQAGVTEEPLDEAVMADWPSWSPPGHVPHREGLRELVPT